MMFFGPILTTFLLLGVARVKTLTTRYSSAVYDEVDEDDASSSHTIILRKTGSHDNQASSTASIERPRKRRATHDPEEPNRTYWDHDIPVVFHDSYLELGKQDVNHVKRVLNRFSNHVCLTFHDVTDRWDPNNPSWFTQNGFPSDAYILVNHGTGCAAGGRKESGPLGVSPCRGTRIITEELFHALGVSHEHQAPSGKNFITINNDNINPSYRRTYATKPSRNLRDIFFDPMSSSMYAPKQWNSNGLETYTPIRDDIFETTWPPPHVDSVVFYELSLAYECKERFCRNILMDCGQGYLTFARGTCRCVCPSELNPENNCRTLVNKSASNLSWPSTPMGILAAGPDNKCPTGFDPQVSWFSFTGKWSVKQENIPIPLPSVRKTISFPICNRRIERKANIDWESWPHGGSTCFIKETLTSCGIGFEEISSNFVSLDSVQSNGSLGDIAVDGNRMTLKMCCRWKDISGLPLDLPNQEPFRLLTKNVCSKVNGMREYQGNDLFAEVNSERHNKVYPCYYLPPVYGCNRIIKLDAMTRSVTITTPGFGSAREPNRRCLYSFQVPKNARTRITFNTYDLHEEDQMLVKRYHKFQQPHVMHKRDWPYHFVSAYEYLTIEYWSSFYSTTHQGISFTADVILAEESCYDVTLRGEDYAGDTSITETYEECLPWAETVDCIDFPANEMTVVRLLTSGNKCRNPDGELDQPWCYTYKNGTNCHKRFCDVCNIQPPADKIKDCATLIREDPEFCHTALQRFGCFKSCGFSQQSTQRVTCSPPTVPSDGRVIERAKPVYFEGEKVKVNCSARANYGRSNMVCTKEGWTPLNQACDECPPEWLLYGDRCFKFFLEKAKGFEAESNCNHQGVSGTLFEIRNAEDQRMLHELKKQLEGDHHAILWISGNTDPGNIQQWRFTNSRTPMTYFNWSPTRTYKLRKRNHRCVVMLAEWWKGEQGKWMATECNDPEHGYVCQLNRLTPGLQSIQVTNRDNRRKFRGGRINIDGKASDAECQDKVGQTVCKEVLTVYPNFCQAEKLKVVSALTCKNSCGYCSVTTQCQEPHSSTYSRISASSLITPGQVMNFTCKPDYYHMSGNLTRACSLSGHLLGQDPICQTRPVAVDWNMNFIRKRLDNLPQHRAVLLDHDGYRIPIDGRITKWYYYCANPGTVYFLVYRRIGGVLTYVGHNTVSCVWRWLWSVNIPDNEQIPVLKNDIVGVFSKDWQTLYVSECDNAPYEPMPNPYIRTRNLDQVLAGKFSGSYCMVPSIGAHIEPPTW